jgi:hypothetical protein
MGHEIEEIRGKPPEEIGEENSAVEQTEKATF